MKILVLPTSQHSWRCIDTNKKRCKWLRTSRFGTVWSCKLFSEQDDRGRWEALEERDGCLVKHPECLHGSSSCMCKQK